MANELTVPSPHQRLRLLTVAVQQCAPVLESAKLAALPGFEVIGDAIDYNEGLRQILMVQPDVVVMRWSLTASKLLRVLAYLCQQKICPSPFVVAITAEAPQPELLSYEGVAMIRTDRFDDNLADWLRQHQLRHTAPRQ
ncbi:MAG: response regulator transcription factor [Gammaproteobacteria bacterium]|nr:response regulator transcription factor [Gammaproteobacteria bacterium]